LFVLDLGCGDGVDLSGFGVAESADRIVGADLYATQLKTNFPGRFFVRAAGEALPFRDSSFDLVLALVSLPYMQIPVALAEISRTLKPDARIYISVHPLRFTLRELLHNAMPHPKASLFRSWVLFNGAIFHVAGRGLGRGRLAESFQTRRGITKALERAGLEDIRVTYPSGRFGPRLHATAKKPRVMARDEKAFFAEQRLSS
jgi:ubiquinone/menaquinone biosynthesis C-methylase UbiE